MNKSPLISKWVNDFRIAGPDALKHKQKGQRSKMLKSKDNNHPILETIEITSDCQYRRTFRSDQGWAYQMKSYARTLEENKIFQSMSRKGNCHDNSVTENFFGIMK